jgi:hypothetical protein
VRNERSLLQTSNLVIFCVYFELREIRSSDPHNFYLFGVLSQNHLILTIGFKHLFEVAKFCKVIPSQENNYENNFFFKFVVISLLSDS